MSVRSAAKRLYFNVLGYCMEEQFEMAAGP